jgi:4-hydroxy-2-oxoheptanedioate aldolase
MRANVVRGLWKEDRAAIGCLLTLHSPLMAEVMGHVGFDWLGVDLQHSETNLAQIQGMFQAISSTPTMPFTRVAGNDSILIQRVLDLGAYGIIVPYVQSVEEARAAVRAAKYPPLGERSWGPIRGALYGGADYFEHANAETVVIVMLETRQAVKQARAILSVPGIDGCFIGPNDLSVSYGGLPERGVLPAAEAGIQEVLAAVRETGTIAGIQTYTAEEATMRAGQGFRFIGLGSEVRLATAAARAALGETRARLS